MNFAIPFFVLLTVACQHSKEMMNPFELRMAERIEGFCPELIDLIGCDNKTCFYKYSGEVGSKELECLAKAKAAVKDEENMEIEFEGIESLGTVAIKVLLGGLMIAILNFAFGVSE